MEQVWSRLCRLVGAVTLAAFAVAAFTPLAVWLVRAAPIEPGSGRADAIVVLGASVSSDGLLDGPSLRRALAGISAERQGRARTLVLLGCRDGNAIEADVRAQLARDLGVPADAILTEPRGLTTAQEARYVAARLEPLGERRILLVTGEAHMFRAADVFRRAGFEVLPLPVREHPAAPDQPEQRLEVVRRMAAERVARLLHGLARGL
jgi:uncharacterized SAM-binding protein YcdF (DUF218 family)